jgi:hypothetical protein
MRLGWEGRWRGQWFAAFRKVARDAVSRTRPGNCEFVLDRFSGFSYFLFQC